MAAGFRLFGDKGCDAFLSQKRRARAEGRMQAINRFLIIESSYYPGLFVESVRPAKSVCDRTVAGCIDKV